MFLNSFPPFYAQEPIAPITLAHSLFYLLKNHQVNRYFTQKNERFTQKTKEQIPNPTKKPFFSKQKSCEL